MASKHPDTPDATRTYRAPARSRSRGNDGTSLLVSTPAGTRVVALQGKKAFTVGRGASCDVVIEDDSLSREHARLSFEGDVTICDLGSKNGTVVAGQRLAPRAPATIALGTPIEVGGVMIVLQRALPVTDGLAPTPSPRKSTRTHSAVIADPAMRHLYALLDVVAPSPLSVLILGETGVGKEVYADALHARSSRARGPFVPVHCAALPETLLEAELFGYEKGAFTGATSRKPGIFESAEGGTVFLDEIGEVPLATQARLLRVLETGEVMRLGSVRPITVDVRFVSATHRDLRALIAAQRFRADLYFRLDGMSIHLPPLRSRRSDIRALAEMFIEKSAKASKRKIPELTATAMARLEAYDWPGNVRELRNVLDRAVLLSAGASIDEEHLAVADPEAFGARAQKHDPAPQADAEDELKSRLRDLEKQRIEDALAKHAGNQSQAAKVLGISRFTLMNKLEAFGMARPRKGR